MAEFPANREFRNFWVFRQFDAENRVAFSAAYEQIPYASEQEINFE
jgi:hypothetical protein